MYSLMSFYSNALPDNPVQPVRQHSHWQLL